VTASGCGTDKNNNHGNHTPLFVLIVAGSVLAITNTRSDGKAMNSKKLRPNRVGIPATFSTFERNACYYDGLDSTGRPKYKPCKIRESERQHQF